MVALCASVEKVTTITCGDIKEKKCGFIGLKLPNTSRILIQDIVHILQVFLTPFGHTHNIIARRTNTNVQPNIAVYVLSLVLMHTLANGNLFHPLNTNEEEKKKKYLNIENHFQIVTQKWFDLEIKKLINVLEYKNNKLKPWIKPLNSGYDKFEKSTVNDIQSAKKRLRIDINAENIVRIAEKGREEYAKARSENLIEFSLHDEVKHEGKCIMNVGYSIIYVLIRKEWLNIIKMVLQIVRNYSLYLFLFVLVLFCVFYYVDLNQK